MSLFDNDYVRTKKATHKNATYFTLLPSKVALSHDVTTLLPILREPLDRFCSHEFTQSELHLVCNFIKIGVNLLELPW